MKNCSKRLLRSFLMMTLVLCGVSCENPNLEDNEAEGKTDREMVNVSFNVSHFEQIPFDTGPGVTRASSDIKQVCSHISFAVFHDDSRINVINQTADDKDFGKFSIRLAKDATYTIVVIAHNGNGNASVYSPDSIRFKDNKVTDTFYYCQTIKVDAQTNYDLQLKRAVAMFRLIVNDKTPSEITKLEFKYTGGSSTFNAITGCGRVKSKQTEIRSVPGDAHAGTSTYEVYTFPRADSDELKMTVTAVDDVGTELQQRVFENVPVKVNQITQYTGKFYEGSPTPADSTFIITIDGAWGRTSTTEY